MSHEKEKVGGNRLVPDSASNQMKPEQGPGRGGGHRILKGLYIALTIISAVIVGAYLFLHFFSAPPEIEVTKPAVTTRVDEQGNLIEVEIPGVPQGRKEQVYTFLLVGQDTVGGGNTDTMMLGTYDVPNQRLNVMSLPRDTYVSYRGRTVLLNSVFNWAGGTEDTDKGMDALKAEVGELTGIVPDFHVLVQWSAVGELVEAIDGVNFNVPCRMDYYDFTQDLLIDLYPGMQHLDGKEAMQLIRWRHNNDGTGYATGDLGRIQTQQDFMKAMIAKCLKPDVLLPNLAEYIRIFQDNVITDMSASNMAYFAKSAVGKLDISAVSFATLPNEGAGDGAHLLPIGSQIVELVNDGFNPYLEDITLSDLELVTDMFHPSRKPSPGGIWGENGTSNGGTGSNGQTQPDHTQMPTLPPTVSTVPTDPQAPSVPAASSTPAENVTSVPTEQGIPGPDPIPTPAPMPDPIPEPVTPTEAEGESALPPESE